MAWEMANPIDHLEFLQKGIKEISKNTPVPYNFEYILKDLLAGNHAFFLEPDAFLVARIDTNMNTGERTLFCWFMYSENGDGLYLYRKDFASLARALNCQYYEWQSARKGYAKYKSVEVKEYIYRIFVPEHYTEGE